MTNLRRAVLFLPRGGVGAVRNRRIPGCGQTGTMLWGGPCYFVKNNEGGAKHQEGLHGRSPASTEVVQPVWEDISAGMSGNTSQAESVLGSDLHPSS